MALQKTLVLLKPEAVERRLVGEILARLERTGLRLAALELRTVDRDFAGQHYGEEIARKHGEKVREALLGYISGRPVVAMVWEGNEAVAVLRAVGGEHFEPARCPPGSIRRDYSTDSREAANAEGRALENLIHASDSPEAAANEVRLWFPDLG